MDEAISVLNWAAENRASVKSTHEKVKQVKAWLAQGWTQSQLERRCNPCSGATRIATTLGLFQQICWKKLKTLFRRNSHRNEIQVGDPATWSGG